MERRRLRRSWVAVVTVVALGGAGALALGSQSVSAAGSVSPTTNADDGSNGSLRHILQNLPDATTTVVLPPGSGPYTLNCAQGGVININNVVVIEGNGNTIQQTCATAGVLETESNLTIRNLTLTGGSALPLGSGGGIEQDGGTALTIDGSTITGNKAGSAACNCDGGGVNVSTGTATAVRITNSTISNNTAIDDGGAVDMNGGSGSALTVIASTLSGNTAGDLGGAVATENSTIPVTIVDSTVTANTSFEGGALGIEEDPDNNLTLVYDTITNNIHSTSVASAGVKAEKHPVHSQQGPAPASLEVTGDYNVFGTVITGPQGGPNCDLGGANSVTSHDFNFSDDTTCGLTAAHDRAASGNNPLLGALANNGGPTQTQLPQVGSPLINFIPIANCGGGNSLAGFAVTTDQRGITRPQETGCEEGSVEVVAPTPVVIQPRFTG